MVPHSPVISSQIRNHSSNFRQDTNDEATWINNQLERKQMLKKVCSKYQNTTRRSFIKSRFMISPQYNFLYCYNAKVASTTWKIIFRKIHRPFKSNPSKKIRNHTRRLISFFTVRHPFERLVSAYEHKNLRNHAKYLHNCTFHQFLTEFVIKEFEECPENNHCMNIHWMPYIR